MSLPPMGIERAVHGWWVLVVVVGGWLGRWVWLVVVEGEGVLRTLGGWGQLASVGWGQLASVGCLVVTLG